MRAMNNLRALLSEIGPWGHQGQPRCFISKIRYMPLRPLDGPLKGWHFLISKDSGWRKGEILAWLWEWIEANHTVNILSNVQ